MGADDPSGHELTERMALEGMFGAPGTVEITYGRIGRLPEPLKVPDDTDVIGTISELPTGRNIYGFKASGRSIVYLKTSRDPKSIFGATFCRRDNDPSISVRAAEWQRSPIDRRVRARIARWSQHFNNL